MILFGKLSTYTHLKQSETVVWRAIEILNNYEGPFVFIIHYFLYTILYRYIRSSRSFLHKYYKQKFYIERCQLVHVKGQLEPELQVQSPGPIYA
jgi:hypothetical protein